MKHVLALLFFSHVFLYGVVSGPFVPISGTGNNGTPLLSVAANGNAFAAWVNYPNNIQAAFFNSNINPPTGVWVTVNPNPIAIGNAPQIGVDQNGNAFIVWVSTIASPATQILVSRFDSTTMQLSEPIQLSIPGTFNSLPKISVNGTGFATVIWFQDAPSFQVLSSGFNPFVGLWSTPTSVFSNILPASFAIDNYNRGLAIFNTASANVPGVIQAVRLFIP